jgi:hypothetical protein
MKIISHRGNLNGPNPKWENTPEYINEAVEDVGLCEVDVWCINSELFLGHDGPVNRISPQFFFSKGTSLYVHCKNLHALQFFLNISSANAFYHDKDPYTLTTLGEIWAYPNFNGIYNRNTIVACPEMAGISPTTPELHFGGVCTDYPLNWRNRA